jgi:TolB-like protein/DNA-binding winged helix-turn-helix (wHTH) protein
MDVSIGDKGVYAFGPFRLDAVRRSLTREGEKLTLPPRLFDTLLYLVENQGRVIEKDELFEAIWGGRVVEEANLTQTIFGLRKALGPGADGAGFILTVPGRGYRFAAPVWLESGAAGMASEQPQAVTQPAALVSPHQQSPPPRRWHLTRLRAAGLAVALALCTSFGWLTLTRPEHPVPGPAPHFSPPPHSVAVLPFANMSGDPSQEYFSDGLSEELIGALSRIAALRVAARTSAFSFKGKPVTVGDIARALNVGAVLEGSVRRSGTRLRVAVELVNAASGFALWSSTYDRDEGDFLTIQEDIAKSVARNLQANLLAGEAGMLTVGGTQNSRAFDAYLRGMRLKDGLDAVANNAALKAFDEAIALAGCGKSEDFALLAGVRERIGSARKVFFSLH